MNVDQISGRMRSFTKIYVKEKKNGFEYIKKSQSSVPLEKISRVWGE